MRWLLAFLVIVVTPACGGRSTPARVVEPAPLVDAGALPERTAVAPDAGVVVPRVVDDFAEPGDPRHRVDCDDCAPGYGCCYGGMCCAKSCKKLDAHGNCPALP